MMASEDCVLSFRTSGPNYRTKQMASGDARDLSVRRQENNRSKKMTWRDSSNGWRRLLRRYDRMEEVSERLGVFSESSFGSFLCEKGVSNGGTLRESSE